MKYLHVMTMDSPIYNNMIVEMINTEDGFGEDEHEFVFTNASSYEISKKYPNTKLHKDYLDSNLNNFNIDGEKYNHLVIHSLNFTRRQFLFLKKRTARRIIWCVWGSDLYNRKKEIPEDFSFYRKLRRMIGNFSFDIIQGPKIKLFNTIVVGFSYDELEVRKLSGNNMRIERAQYGLGYDFQMINKVISDMKKKESTDPINIMIGHSSYPFLNHLKILNVLEKFKDENINISMPLNYGDKEYGQKVVRHAQALFKDKVQIISDYMEPKEYLEYLTTVDVAIFDFEHQAALGNIYLLLYMGKKLILNPNGIIYQGLTKEGVQVLKVNSLKEMSFNELAKINLDFSKGIKYGKSMIDPNIITTRWRMLFNKLRNENIN